MTKYKVNREELINTIEELTLEKGVSFVELLKKYLLYKWYYNKQDYLTYKAIHKLRQDNITIKYEKV